MQPYQPGQALPLPPIAELAPPPSSPYLFLTPPPQMALPTPVTSLNFIASPILPLEENEKRALLDKLNNNESLEEFYESKPFNQKICQNADFVLGILIKLIVEINDITIAAQYLSKLVSFVGKNNKIFTKEFLLYCNLKIIECLAKNFSAPEVLQNAFKEFSENHPNPLECYIVFNFEKQPIFSNLNLWCSFLVRFMVGSNFKINVNPNPLFQVYLNLSLDKTLQWTEIPFLSLLLRCLQPKKFPFDSKNDPELYRAIILSVTSTIRTANTTLLQAKVFQWAWQGYFLPENGIKDQSLYLFVEECLKNSSRSNFAKFFLQIHKLPQGDKFLRVLIDQPNSKYSQPALFQKMFFIDNASADECCALVEKSSDAIALIFAGLESHIASLDRYKNYLLRKIYMKLLSKLIFHPNKEFIAQFLGDVQILYPPNVEDSFKTLVRDLNEHWDFREDLRDTLDEILKVIETPFFQKDLWKYFECIIISLIDKIGKNSLNGGIFYLFLRNVSEKRPELKFTNLILLNKVRTLYQKNVLIYLPLCIHFFENYPASIWENDMECYRELCSFLKSDWNLFFGTTLKLLHGPKKADFGELLKKEWVPFLKLFYYYSKENPHLDLSRFHEQLSEIIKKGFELDVLAEGALEWIAKIIPQGNFDSNFLVFLLAMKGWNQKELEILKRALAFSNHIPSKRMKIDEPTEDDPSN